MERKYTRIRSEFVRAKLRKSRWRDHAYPDDLMQLEELSLTIRRIKGAERFYAGLRLSALRVRYGREYHAILRQLDPAGYLAALKREEKHREYLAAFKRRKKLEDKTALEEWLRAGGRK